MRTLPWRQLSPDWSSSRQSHPHRIRPREPQAALRQAPQQAPSSVDRPVRAAGAVVGGTVGAASQTPPRDRVIVEERAPRVSQKTCVEDATRKDCVETRR